MQQPGRTVSASGYRYSFNDQEKETELNENITTAQFWEYDSRIGRRWNMDPKPNPSVSFYATFENNPLCKKDPLGDSSVFDNRGNKLYYNKKDKDLRVFMRDEKGKQTLIGTLGKNINVEVIANNILKDNKTNAQHMAYAGWIVRVLPHSLWDYKNKTSTIFGVAWGYDEGDADGIKKSGHTSFITSKYTFKDAAAFGNYNAGYTGTQAAIKREDQYWWAGMGEVAKFNNSWERIKQIWNGTKPYGDQPLDYMRNTEGMNDADAEIKREGGKPKVSVSENMAKYSPYIY